MTSTDAVIELVARQVGAGYETLRRPSDADGPSADVATLEYDEHGSPTSPDRLKRILDHIRTASRSNGALVFLFIHGWNHNAAWSDPHFAGFRDILIRFAMREDERFTSGPLMERRVVGIYVGWPGLIHENWRQLLTFRECYRRAEAIAKAGHLGNALTQIAAATKEANEESPVVFIGHSLGAMMLETTVLELLRRHSGGKPPALPDLALFLNSAAKHQVAEELAKRILRLDLENRAGPAARGFEAPRLISAASESDAVTKLLFPLGKFTNTDGNTPSLFTHILEHTGRRAISEPLPAPKDFGQPWHSLRAPVIERGKLTIPIDLPQPDEPGLAGRPEGSARCWAHDRYLLHRKRDSPFWLFQIPKEIVKSHNGIDNDRAWLLVMALTQLSGAIMSLHTDYESQFDDREISWAANSPIEGCPHCAARAADGASV